MCMILAVTITFYLEAYHHHYTLVPFSCSYFIQLKTAILVAIEAD